MYAQSLPVSHHFIVSTGTGTGLPNQWPLLNGPIFLLLIYDVATYSKQSAVMHFNRSTGTRTAADAILIKNLLRPIAQFWANHRRIQHEVSHSHTGTTYGSSNGRGFVVLSRRHPEQFLEWKSQNGDRDQEQSSPFIHHFKFYRDYQKRPQVPVLLMNDWRGLFDDTLVHSPLLSSGCGDAL